MRINRDKTTLSNNRWAKYAAAGAAGAVAALGPQTSVDADFTFVETNTSIENPVFDSNFLDFGPYTFGDANAGFLLRHGGFAGGAGVMLGFVIDPGAGNSMRMAGTNILDPGYYYASNLQAGQFISTAGNFTPGIQYVTSFDNQGQLAWGEAASYANDQFDMPGLSFLGFQFDVGAGTQYGFAELIMNGAPNNGATLVGYGWGMAGDTVFAGQREFVIPEPGCLGMLAFGSIGLMTWRRKRAAA